MGFGQETFEGGDWNFDWPLYIEVTSACYGPLGKCYVQDEESVYYLFYHFPALARHIVRIFSSACLESICRVAQEERSVF